MCLFSVLSLGRNEVQSCRNVLMEGYVDLHKMSVTSLGTPAATAVAAKILVKFLRGASDLLCRKGM